MTEEHEQRLYQIIHRMVIWDESREDVLAKLEVNGITGDKALEMYARARAERITGLRGNAIRKGLAGLLLMGAGISVYWVAWEWLGNITQALMILCFVVTLIGFWKATEGVVGYLFAPTRRGSLADEE